MKSHCPAIFCLRSTYPICGVAHSLELAQKKQYRPDFDRGDICHHYLRACIYQFQWGGYAVVAAATRGILRYILPRTGSAS